MDWRSWDGAGMFLSLLCLAHCVALPALLAVLPLLDLHYHPDERLHHLLAFLAIPVAALALLPAYRRHGKLGVPMLGMIGLALLFTGPVLHASHALPHWVEAQTAFWGALALVSAHAWNLRLGGCACSSPATAGQ